MPLPRPLPIGRGIPSPQSLPPRRLRRLDTRAYGARPLGAFGALMLAPSALYLARRLQILDHPLRLNNMIYDLNFG